jgi:uncharacterized protein YndB with AHSA1/START domain
METKPLVIEHRYHAPIAMVWKAITDQKEMKHWYFDLAEFKPEPGFEFQFQAGDEQKEYLHICKITEVIAGKKISYSWKYDGYEGMSFVTFELFPEGEYTKLKLTHAGLETFPAGDPAFSKESFAAGWDSLLGTSLKSHLENSGTPG